MQGINIRNCLREVSEEVLEQNVPEEPQTARTVWDSDKSSRRTKSATSSNNLKWVLRVTHVALNHTKFSVATKDSTWPVGLSVPPRNWGNCSEEQN